MSININTCYVAKIQNQLDAAQDKKTGKLNISGKHRVNDRLMCQTASVCLEALKFCVSVIQTEWDVIMATESKYRRRLIDTLIHEAKTTKPKYPEFDKRFPYMPAYTRRAIIADAFGEASLYSKLRCKKERNFGCWN